MWQNVWRKRKEKDYVNMLSHERSKSKAMDEQLAEMKKQIESLKSQVRSPPKFLGHTYVLHLV